MRKRSPNEEEKGKEITGSKSISMKKKPKNWKRGFSLEASADANSKRNYYNPALIKKNQEFYKNAKYISKFKKSMKEQGLSSATSHREVCYLI
ncbi:hypothetical protein PanWU01x14_175940 [Parasponia andersonii]|uniref:Uncharacterized protein n=1 Tax=Parasponia andersonii TaxID=3476 RepID=A0A2P5C7X8_PARAD|nr:hypothetical protein PanWU01x14_175940 [Parasponia andersonii]